VRGDLLYTYYQIIFIIMAAFPRVLSVLSVLFVFSSIASATADTGVDTQWICSMKLVSFALGWFMMVVMGIKWIVSENTNDRGDAKKGMIYIILGLLVIANLCNFYDLYCYAANMALQSSTKKVDCASNKLVLGCPTCATTTTTTTTTLAMVRPECPDGCETYTKGDGTTRSYFNPFCPKICCPGAHPTCNYPDKYKWQGEWYFCCSNSGITIRNCWPDCIDWFS
jgi:hypothetical protein